MTSHPPSPQTDSPIQPSPTLSSSSPNDSSLDFFTLNNDGSVPDLIETCPPPGQTTPPAALSSLAVRMADRSLSESVNTLDNEQYDMVDDASEVSNEDNETVSIVSTDEDEGGMTPDETGSMVDVDEAADIPGDVASDSHTHHALQDYQMQLMLLEQQEKKRLLLEREQLRGMESRLSFHRQNSTRAMMLAEAREKKGNAAEAQRYRADVDKEDKNLEFLNGQYQELKAKHKFVLRATPRLAESISHLLNRDPKNPSQEEGIAGDDEDDEMIRSEDLETPRQSTIHKAQRIEPSTSTATKSQKHYRSLFEKYLDPAMKVLDILSGILIAALMASALYSTVNFFIRPSPTSDLANRRDALSSALVKMASNPDATKSVNIAQLVPSPVPVSTNIFGRDEYGTSQVHFQGVPPNNIIVSLPKLVAKSAPVPKLTEVTKATHPIAFNQTRLLDGIYAITFDPSEAHGIVTVNTVFKTYPNVTVEHNFGRRLFHYQTYEKASTDLTNSVNKDVATACRSARSLSQRLSLDFGASVKATRNVTSQLAIAMRRDLQLWVSGAASLAQQARNSTTSTLRNDLHQAQKGLVKAGKDLQVFLGRTGELVRAPLVLSRERAVMLKEAFRTRKARKAGEKGSLRQGKIHERTLVEKKGCGCGCGRGGTCGCGGGKNAPCKKELKKGKGDGKGGCPCAGKKTRPTVKPFWDA